MEKWPSVEIGFLCFYQAAALGYLTHELLGNSPLSAAHRNAGIADARRYICLIYTGMELRLSGLRGQHFHLLSHPTGPAFSSVFKLSLALSSPVLKPWGSFCLHNSSAAIPSLFYHCLLTNGC